MSKKIKKNIKIILLFSCILLAIFGVLKIKDEINRIMDERIDLPTPNSEVAEPPENLPELINYWDATGLLELPVNGASGYAAISIHLRSNANTESNILITLAAGQGFQILKEEGDWWNIDVNGTTGWVMHKYCFINLPDVIPSIVYNNSNASASKLKSSGKNIPGITGQQLYRAYEYNFRFGENMFVMPVLYSMAPKICLAQQNALAEGNTLVIFEGFRPYSIQKNILSNLSVLAEQDTEVRAGITTPPWSTSWFIATGLSNHQKGYAIDVSLGKIIEFEEKTLNKFRYKDIKRYEEYQMPTEIHELSSKSAIFKWPVDPKSTEAWKSGTIAESMNDSALLLQKYCVNAGLTPLASEWWHFNDLSSAKIASANSGDFFISQGYSTAPIVVR